MTDKLATPVAADQIDDLAAQLYEQAVEVQVKEGMQTIRQTYAAIGGTQQDFLTVMDNLSTETDEVPVTMYRFINYCLSAGTGFGPLRFYEIDRNAAARFGIHVRRW